MIDLILSVPSWVYLYAGIGFTWASINYLFTDVNIKAGWDALDEETRENTTIKAFGLLVKLYVYLLFVYDCVLWPVSLIRFFFTK